MGDPCPNCQATGRVQVFTEDNSNRTGQLASYDVVLAPETLVSWKEALKPHTASRWRTEEGIPVDARNYRWASVVYPPVENLIADMKRNLIRLSKEGDQGARKALRMDMDRILRMSRHKLPPEIVAQVDEELAKPLLERSQPTN